MSTLKRTNDTFYIDSPSSKRVSLGKSTQRKPLGTFANGHTHLPPTPLSTSKVKKEYYSAINKGPEPAESKEPEEEEEPESQLPINEHAQIQRNLRQEYDELMLAFKKQSYEIKTLENRVQITEAQLASSQEQLQLLGTSRQELIDDIQTKQQKFNQTELRLRVERDCSRNDLASVEAERDRAASECDTAQRAASKAEEELQEYREFFALQGRLLTKSRTRSH
ncbi:hypothetical protein EV360DRAFT_88700 [Lentinula raphanica]|nr:hypothetical protein EV360DRAFT_88700 [Lentinula raphanica]